MANPARVANGLLVAATLLALLGDGAATAQTIRVGIVLGYTGPLAAISTQIERGLSLYVKEHERYLPQGVNIQLIRRDDSGRPDAAAAAATELISRDRVDFLTGGATSASAAAIAAVTADAKVPFIVMNAANVGLTRRSPYVVRTSVTLPQTSQAIGMWAAQQGGKTGYTIVADFPGGHDAEAAFAKGFTDNGGKIVGGGRVKLVNLVEPFLQTRSLRPDVLFVFVPPGAQAMALVRSYDEAGLRSAGIRLVGPQDIAPDNALADMGEGARGLVTSGNYSSAAERPQNREFITAWMRVYGEKAMPDFMAVAAWDGMAAIFEVIRQRKGRFSSDQAMEVLRNWKNPNSPRGPMSIDPETRETIQNIYIRRVENVNGRLVNVEFETIPFVRASWN